MVIAAPHTPPFPSHVERGSSDPTAPGCEGLHTLGALAERTGQSIVSLAGHLQQIDSDASSQLDVVADIAQQARTLTDITQDMSDGLTTVAKANENAMQTVESSVDTLKRTAERSKDVAIWIGNLDTVLSTVEGTLQQVSKANVKIAEIAKHVNILAVNARIEAARAGEAGRGFAVVAEAINRLSQETSTAAGDVTGSTQSLQKAVANLRSDAQDITESAHQVLEDSAHVDQALAQLNEDVSKAAEDTLQLTSKASSVTSAVNLFGPAFDGLAVALKATAKGVHDANRRAEEIIETSEQAVQVSVQLGADNSDSALIELVQDRAAAIALVFENGIAEGRITAAALFDSRYAPIPNTQPQQVTTPFTAFTDAVLPALQNSVLSVSARIVFCAAVDRNGYLPTHNPNFSKPQSPDPVWNAAHCRNRRIFDDRVGLKSGRNTAPFLMQTYRRDMGGGAFELMKDISAPIIVQGRHWGGLRMGLRPQK